MDSYDRCKANDVCREIVNEENGVILNYMMNEVYNRVTNKAMTNEEW